MIYQKAPSGAFFVIDTAPIAHTIFSQDF